MRISDWSSDVCSSDLRRGRVSRIVLIHTVTLAIRPCSRPFDGAPPRSVFVWGRQARPMRRMANGSASPGAPPEGGTAPPPELLASDAEGAQLGRASCRDGVRQYV